MLDKKVAGSIFILLTFIYLAILVWIGSSDGYAFDISKYLDSLPTLLSLSFLSYFLRYSRLNWLITRSQRKIKFIMGFAAYLSGFALTASPGKIGELVRIRYFDLIGLPPHRTIAGFIYERTFDVLVVFLLCLVGFHSLKALYISSIFVFFVVLGVVTLVWNTSLVSSIFTRLRLATRFSSILSGIEDGLQGVRVWLTPLDIFMSLLIGLLAWGCAAVSFVVLLRAIGVDLETYLALSLYPLAVLVGAASMIPGGFGTTEAAIVTLLSMHGVPVDLSLLAAVGIRISSMWFSMLLGFLSIIFLELMQRYKRD